MQAHFGSLAEDAAGLLDGEMAHRVEDPINRETQLALAAFPCPLQALEDGLKGLRDRGCATCR